jgi:hypothetical protein
MSDISADIASISYSQLTAFTYKKQGQYIGLFYLKLSEISEDM